MNSLEDTTKIKARDVFFPLIGMMEYGGRNTENGKLKKGSKIKLALVAGAQFGLAYLTTLGIVHGVNYLQSLNSLTN